MEATTNQAVRSQLWVLLNQPIKTKPPQLWGNQAELGLLLVPSAFDVVSHRMADCRKGEKYGKGLLIDSGEVFNEQGDREEQEAVFDDDKEVNEEFVTRDDG
jgi:hypothetical protein